MLLTLKMSAISREERSNPWKMSERKIGRKRLKIITYDVEGEIARGNIRIRLVPIWKYLLLRNFKDK